MAILKSLLNLAVGIIVVITLGLGLKISMTIILLIVSEMVLLFIFRDKFKEMSESVFFFFVRRPFDVGDRVEIDGKQMVVKKMSILATEFLGDDNHVTTTPNNVLATKSIKGLTPASISTT